MHVRNARHALRWFLWNPQMSADILYRILLNSDSEFRKYGQKFIYSSKRRMAFIYADFRETQNRSVHICGDLQYWMFFFFFVEWKLQEIRQIP